MTLNLRLIVEFCHKTTSLPQAGFLPRRVTDCQAKQCTGGRKSKLPFTPDSRCFWIPVEPEVRPSARISLLWLYQRTLLFYVHSVNIYSLQYLPHCYLQKSLLSFKVYIDTMSPSSCWDFLHLGEALRGEGVPCSERTVSQPTSNLISLPASNRMISFPLTSSLCDFNRAEVNITPVNQPFLFICAEAEL